MEKINLHTLILYDDIRKNKVVEKATMIYNAYIEGRDISAMEDLYYQTQRELLFMTKDGDISGTYWQNFICGLLVKSENCFSLMAERETMDENIRKLAKRELEEIKKLFTADWYAVSKRFGDEETAVFSMKIVPQIENEMIRREKIAQALKGKEKEKSLDMLYEYYKTSGCGIFEEYEAFVWDEGLVGVKNYDKITFEQLIGYERQKEQLIENTEFFLKGYRANNVLLYGDRGTGKSSSVKALLNRFKDQKLKMLSLNKNNVKDLYRIIESIADRGCKFIIFIDDLSFEETEIEYKYFKSVIEGGIEAQPANILIYVTSNRRNIIRETWKDRSSETGDVHHNDGIQERMSLADRFGLSITFTSPDKQDYLNIVRELAKQEGLLMDEEELTAQALTWELRHNGRSGRVAKQFIYHMKAKMLKA